MTERDFFDGWDDHLKPLKDEGYIFDDPRFLHVQAWSMLLMHVHDALLSLKLLEKTSKYENGGSVEELTLQQALLRNSVMNYAKCFSQSGTGRKTLDKNSIFKDSPSLLDTHERVMLLRNKFFAHSDSSGIDFACLATKEKEDRILIKQLYTIKIPLDEISGYETLYSYCGSQIKTRIDKALDSAESKAGKPVVSA